MDHATCFRLLSATHFATSLLPLTVRLIPVLTEIGRLIVGFRMELENFLDFLLVFRLSEVSGSSFRRTWVTCECFAVPAAARPACLAPLAVV